MSLFRMIHRFRAVGVAVVVLTLLGAPMGLLWAALAPRAEYLIVGHKAFLTDSESEALIGADARFMMITAVAGLVCGVLAYVSAGRFGELRMLVALTVGGGIAAVLAWRVGHLVGLETYQRLLRTARDGTMVTGVLDLRALGALVAWPLSAVATFGLLEAFDPADRAPLVAGDVGEGGAGQPDEVDGGELDLQAAPTGRDTDGRKA